MFSSRERFLVFLCRKRPDYDDNTVPVISSHHRHAGPGRRLKGSGAGQRLRWPSLPVWMVFPEGRGGVSPIRARFSLRLTPFSGQMTLFQEKTTPLFQESSKSPLDCHKSV